MPEATLKALADSEGLGEIMSADGGDCEGVLSQFAKLGININALAAELQEDGERAFVNSWNELMAMIVSKSEFLWKKV
jgi:transaldolase